MTQPSIIDALPVLRLPADEFTAENTRIAKNGTRHCRECQRAYDQQRTRPAGYWARVNARRRGT